MASRRGRTPRVAFVYHDDYLHYDFGPDHPMKSTRLALTRSLVRALGLLDQGVHEVRPGPVDRRDLLRVHTPTYVDLVERLGEPGAHDGAAHRHGLGIGDNPIFPGMYGATALHAGGTLLAVRRVLAGEDDHAFSPGGGFHHAMPDRASGFCIFNDPAVALRACLDNGTLRRAVYVDIDAHHGDGVQSIFYSDPRVMTISLHEDGRFLFPGTGFIEEIGEGEGLGYSANVPLPPYTEDDAYLHAFRAVVPPLVRSMEPDLVFTQMGMDTHFTDPITHFRLTTRAYRGVFQELHALARQVCHGRWVGVGGGGYDPEAVARGWALAVAEMAGAGTKGPLPPPWVQECTEALGTPPPQASMDDPPSPRKGVPQAVVDVVHGVKAALSPYHHFD